MFSSKENFKLSYTQKINSLYAKAIEEASPYEKYYALGTLIRDYINANWANTNKLYKEFEQKQIYYFSMEFLLGKMLEMNLMNLGIKNMCAEALRELNIDFEELVEAEKDPGLGNGGLGRLAACFLDSLSSLNMPGHGCGIRYKYGLFEQKIVDGYQVELPDYWLKEGNVWEIRRADKAVEVRFGGNIIEEYRNGKFTYRQEGYTAIKAVPYDVPIIGYGTAMVNTLRLWSAEPADRDFDFPSFSKGEYLKAVENAYQAEAISEILYPDDNHFSGQLLRLKQEYFLVSSGLQSIIRRFKKNNNDITKLHTRISIHVNDTHPAMMVPELMRILMDEEGMGWDEAWSITTATLSYTNHTILSEALEKWPIAMFKQLLPRIYMIVHEINERFCREVYKKYKDLNRVRVMAIEADGYIKMAHLVIVGSHSVNGVAKIHTEILKKRELANFYDFYPDKFNNKTNGITQRRWLLKANPGLADLVSKTIGTSWIMHPENLIKLKLFAQNPSLREEVARIKRNNKLRLSHIISKKSNIKIDPESIFDVHIKRLHGYKRQILNVLHIMDLYNRILEDPSQDIVPRTFIFGAKAAPGYYYAKTIIKLINTLAEKINKDPVIKDRIKVIFMENYNVSVAEAIIPAADVSEQISMATKEASGTGNMKFMMNGAVTIATMDGANIEIHEQVGSENMVVFGLSSQEVLTYYKNGNYSSMEEYKNNPRLKQILDQLIHGFFPVSSNEFMDIYNSLVNYNDEFFVLKDFNSYIQAQARVDALYRNRPIWNRMCIHNIAHSGIFSSDRTIYEYCAEIWGVKPVFIDNNK